MTETTEKTWLEVSLRVNGELAESISEVLSRFTRGGAAIEAEVSGDGEPLPFDFSKDLVRVCGYILVDDNLADTRRKLEEALWYLGRIQPLPEVNYKYIQEQDWSEAWKQHYHPITVGKSLMVVPAWLSPETGAHVPVLMDPGMAFGTGTHPSTILCLEFIEEYLSGLETVDRSYKTKKSRKPDVIDIGCGSGILCIAAMKLGAKKGLAVDMDPIAVEATRQNVLLNSVGESVEIGLGSLAEIQAGKFSFNKADLVFVNILAPVIVQLLGEGLRTIMTERGRLILSGLIAEQEQQVIEALKNCRMRIEKRRVMGDWIALAVVNENP